MATEDKILKEVEQVFKKHKLSGFVYMPKMGTYSFTQSHPDKLMLLEFAKVELEKQKLQIKNEALEILQSKTYTKPTKDISYIK